MQIPSPPLSENIVFSIWQINQHSFIYFLVLCMFNIIICIIANYPEFDQIRLRCFVLNAVSSSSLRRVWNKKFFHTRSF